MTEKMLPMQSTQENVNSAYFPCPKCSGCLVEVGERDSDGDYLEMLRCLNCGFRQYAQPTSKSIEVVKGLAYE